MIVFTEIEKKMLILPVRSEKKSKDNNKSFCFCFYFFLFCSDKIFYCRYVSALLILKEKN